MSSSSADPGRRLTARSPFHYVSRVIDITEVAEDIYRFETPIDFAQYPPTVYVIRDSGGVVIEPGPSATVPTVLQALESLAIKELSYIMPTHIHMDHAGGAGTLARLFPQAKVVVHPRGARHAIDPSRLIDSVKMVWGEDFESRFGPIDPVPEEQLLVPEDGEVIALGERELQVLYAPGHAPHHIVIYDRKARGLFCGEALGLPVHQLPTVAPMSFDLETYLQTIERLQRLELGAEVLFYSHGGVEREPERLMARAADNVRVYGDMILDALKRGESAEDIGRMVCDHIDERYGIEVDRRGQQVTVAGYTIYFQSKGLV